MDPGSFRTRVQPPFAFGKEKVILGVVHLRPLPGSPGFGGDLEAVHAAALADAEHLAAGGVHGLVVENFGDAPFHPNRVEPHTTAIMAVLVREIRRKVSLPVGVNVLRNDGAAALAAALAGGGSFVRVNVFTAAVVTDQGLIQGEAHRILRYRRAIGSRAAVFADVHVKHGRPLAERSIEAAARDAWERGGADGLILTGSATGAPVSPRELAAVRGAVPEAPLLAGSGVTPENAEAVLAHTDGAIVGTYFKHEGRVEAAVDRARVETLMQAVRRLD